MANYKTILYTNIIFKIGWYTNAARRIDILVMCKKKPKHRNIAQKVKEAKKPLNDIKVGRIEFW